MSLTPEQRADIRQHLDAVERRSWWYEQDVPALLTALAEAEAELAKVKSSDLESA